jgi:precorrin-6B methylase 2
MFHNAGGRDVRWNARSETLHYIAAEVQAGQRTLEIGAGASTVVFAACGASHTAVSPARHEHLRIAEYSTRIGLSVELVRFVDESSDDALPKLAGDAPLDFAFIDGTHAFPYAIVEWHYLRRMLRVGGRLIMDDVPIPTVNGLYRYLHADPDWRLERLLDDRAATFVKLRETPVDQPWRKQEFNKTYPDYSFLPAWARVRASTGYRVRRAKSRLGDRFPALRRAYRRVQGQAEAS